MWNSEVEISELVGKTLTAVVQSDDDETITFKADDGSEYRMYHSQDCCESVRVEDVCGDLLDLVGSPILEASEETSDKNPEGVTKEYQDSFTWTFYKLGTNKGRVTIRWYGESNGCYSERVSFCQDKKPENRKTTDKL